MPGFGTRLTMTPTLTRQGPICSPAATNRVATPADAAGGSVRILYAEDDPLLRRLGKLVPARSDYFADTVEAGAAAWLALNEVSCHLLITDHAMPHLTGLELITNLRRAGMHLPVVMTSGSINPLEDLSDVVTGLTAFQAKPFTTEILPATVGETLHTAIPRNPVTRASLSVSARQPGSRSRRQHGGLKE